MTPEQIQHVQESFNKVVPIADQAADLFYDRLFELEPSLRSMFPEDMTEQKKKLMHMLTIAVKGLDNLEKIIPAVRELGRRHVKYDVKDEHYPLVGAALIDTLEKGLGTDFTDDIKDSWMLAFGILSLTMIQAGRDEQN